MDIIILDIIKFTLPALIVFLTVFTMLTKQANKEEKLKLYELKSKQAKEALPLRLQAFERITLLLHRLAPENLIPRVQTPSSNVKTFSVALLKTIKSEFEHNITQQIYLSNTTWNRLYQYRADLEALIREKASEINPDESGIKLSEAILQAIIDNPQLLGYQDTMKTIKREVKELFI